MKLDLVRRQDAPKDNVYPSHGSFWRYSALSCIVSRFLNKCCEITCSLKSIKIFDDPKEEYP
jgi:hypothetical protein